ncbi:MAG: hypothetical protein [Circular genetic element sp.]|nr:MAG: hypothetical protein [Circular genetic element sp.]
MPKYAGRRRPTTYRKSYGMRRRATVRKPYGGSKYGNDAFVKIEKTNNLAVSAPSGTGLAGEIFSTMRNDEEPITSNDGNTYLEKQQEWISFAGLYARYEIVGMKAEVTLNPRFVYTRANLYAGLAPSIANPATMPS